MAPLTLLMLPADVLVTLFDHLERPSVLKQLCLTCEALRNIAQPRLCRDVVLDLAQYSFPDGLVGFFLPQNPVHQYVRRLRFTAGGSANDAALWNLMRLALQLVPRDQLRELLLPSDLVLDANFYLQAWIFQRSLENFKTGPAGDVMYNTFASPAFPKHCLSSMRSVNVKSGFLSLRELNSFGTIVEQARRLERLSINGASDRNSRIRERLSATAQSDGAPVEELFGHIVPRGSYDSLRLQKLNLAYVDLAHVSRTYTRAIDFTRLHLLSISACTHFAALLDALTSLYKARGTALRRCRFSDTMDSDSDFMAISRFCKSFTGLRGFHVKNSLPRLIEVHKKIFSFLSDHLPTLTQLVIGLDDDDHVAEPPERDLTYTAWCSKGTLDHCQALETLATMLPPLRLPDPQKGILGDFGVVMATLAKLPRLRLISSFNSPTPSSHCLICEDDEEDIHDDELRELKARRYLDELEKAVTGIYRHMTESVGVTSVARLPYLSFGGHTIRDMDREYINICIRRVYYQAVLMTNKAGITQLFGIRVSETDVMYELGIKRWIGKSGFRVPQYFLWCEDE